MVNNQWWIVVLFQTWNDKSRHNYIYPQPYRYDSQRVKFSSSGTLAEWLPARKFTPEKKVTRWLTSILEILLFRVAHYPNLFIPHIPIT